MSDITKQFDPNWVVCPGDTITDILERENLSKDILTKNSIPLEILEGKPYNWDIATKLAHVLGGSARFWMKREENYRKGLQKGKQDMSGFKK